MFRKSYPTINISSGSESLDDSVVYVETINGEYVEHADPAPAGAEVCEEVILNVTGDSFIIVEEDHEEVQGGAQGDLAAAALPAPQGAATLPLPPAGVPVPEAGVGAVLGPVHPLQVRNGALDQAMVSNARFHIWSPQLASELSPMVNVSGRPLQAIVDGVPQWWPSVVTMHGLVHHLQVCHQVFRPPTPDYVSSNYISLLFV